MGSKWLYICFQDLFKTAESILVLFLFSNISKHLPRVQVVHLYSCTNWATAWIKSHFILSEKSDFYLINNLSIAVHAFPMHILTLLSEGKMLLARYVGYSTNFKSFLLQLKFAPSCLKYMNSALFAFILKPMPLAVCSRLCSKDSVWAGLLARSTKSSMKSAFVIVSADITNFLSFFSYEIIFFY